MFRFDLAAAILLTPFIVGAVAARSSPVVTPALIAFASDRRGTLDIYATDTSGNKTRPLVVSKAAEADPSWSPDRSKILYASNRDGRWHIWIANADGTKQHRLTTTKRGADTNPSWAPNGKTIAFTSSRDGDWEIYTMTPSGLNQRNVSEDTGADDLHPNWNPDSRTIAFERVVGTYSDLYRTDIRHPKLVRILKTATPEFDPAYSPTGTQIAFDRIVRGNQDVWVMNVDGSGQRRLTSDRSEDDEPVWSPDTKEIVFTSFRDGDYELYATDRSGKRQRNVTQAHTANDFEPAFATLGTVVLSVRGQAVVTHAFGLTCTTPAPSSTASHIYGYEALSDVLCGTPMGERLSSRGKADIIWGDIGRDTYEGGCGGDVMYARDYLSDTLYGGSTSGDCGSGDAARVDKTTPRDVVHGIENPNL